MGTSSAPSRVPWARRSRKRSSRWRSRWTRRWAGTRNRWRRPRLATPLAAFVRGLRLGWLAVPLGASPLPPPPSPLPPPCRSESSLFRSPREVCRRSAFAPPRVPHRPRAPWLGLLVRVLLPPPPPLRLLPMPLPSLVALPTHRCSRLVWCGLSACLRSQCRWRRAAQTDGAAQPHSARRPRAGRCLVLGACRRQTPAATPPPPRGLLGAYLRGADVWSGDRPPHGEETAG